MEFTELSPFGSYYFQVLLKTSQTDISDSEKSATIRIAPEGT